MANHAASGDGRNEHAEVAIKDAFAATPLMTSAFPNTDFYGFDYHDGSI
jgi:hypothetical protein